MAKTKLIGVLRLKFIVLRNPKHDPPAKSTLATKVIAIALTFEFFLPGCTAGVIGGVVMFNP